MFEKATRMKLRWNYKGILSVEDLWDLSLRVLDAMYKELNSQLKTTQEESLLETPTKENDELRLKVSIIKYIVETRLAEKAANEQKAEKAAKKQKLLSLIEKKKDESLEQMSVEELTALVNNL